MKLGRLIIYRIAGALFLLASLYTVFSTIVVLAYLLFDVKPYIRKKDNSVIGFTEYLKGIPLQGNGVINLPDSSIRTTYTFPSGGKAQMERHVYKGNLFAAYQQPPAFDSATITDQNIIRTVINRGRSIWGDPTVNAVDIKTCTVYMWPPTLKERLWLFLPELMLRLTFIFCSLHLFLLMRKIVNRDVFRNKAYRHLVLVGLAIILLQAFYYSLSYTKIFADSVSVRFQSSDSNNWIPVNFSIGLQNPFSLNWFAIGLMILVVAKGLQAGYELQKEQDLTI